MIQVQCNHSLLTLEISSTWLTDELVWLWVSLLGTPLDCSATKTLAGSL